MNVIVKKMRIFWLAGLPWSAGTSSLYNTEKTLFDSLRMTITTREIIKLLENTKMCEKIAKNGSFFYSELGMFIHPEVRFSPRYM